MNVYVLLMTCMLLLTFMAPGPGPGCACVCDKVGIALSVVAKGNGCDERRLQRDSNYTNRS